MRYLLDTCVISELVSKRPNLHVVQWIDSIDSERVFLSVITVGEIKKGIEKLPDSARKQTLRVWLEDELMARFQGRILPIDTAAMLMWGELTAKLEQQGRKMPAIDSLIAAIALHEGAALVTRNEEDFRHTGVEIVNPWKSE